MTALLLRLVALAGLTLATMPIVSVGVFLALRVTGGDDDPRSYRKGVCIFTAAAGLLWLAWLFWINPAGFP